MELLLIILVVIVLLYLFGGWRGAYSYGSPGPIGILIFFVLILLLLHFLVHIF